MTLRPLLLTLAVAAALAGCERAPSTDTTAAAAPAAATQNAGAKASQLKQLYADYWEANLKLNPVMATFTGDPRYNAELPDFGSAAYRDQVKKFTTDWLKKVEAIGSEGLTGQDLLSYEIFVEDAKDTLDSFQSGNWNESSVSLASSTKIS